MTILSGQVQQVEINWGDSSSVMVIKSSETYFDMKIITDGGEQKIYYHPTWMENGKLVHWLDEQKKPQHRFKNAGSYNITYTETDMAGNQITNQGNITIPSTGTSDIIRAAPAVQEPNIFYPVIANAAGQNFVVPDISSSFTANFSMASLPASNYILKEVMWELIPPWKINGDLLSGYKVVYNDFVVPSSSMDLTQVANDPFQNTINFKVFFSYRAPSVSVTNLGGGIQASTFTDYFAAPDAPFVIPVQDVVPLDDNAGNLPTDYCAFTVLPAVSTNSMTGDILPPGIKIEIKDENPNLIQANLQSLLCMLPPNIAPDQVNERIASIPFGNPIDFKRFPQPGMTATGRNDFYSKSKWETQNDPNMKYPFHYKGRAVIWNQISGFGPGSPYIEGPEILIRDNDAPNIILHLYDIFNNEVRNDLYLTDKNIPVDPLNVPACILEKIDPNDDTLYKYVDYSAYNATNSWENETPPGKLLEDTRIFGEIYVIDNVDTINGTPIRKYKHLQNVKYHVVKAGEPDRMVDVEITYDDDIKSEKFVLSPLLFRKPGNYEMVITVEDRAYYDENNIGQVDLSMSSITGKDNNIRTFTVKLLVTDIQQRTDSLNDSKGKGY